MMKRYLALFSLLALMVPILVSAADPLGPPKASLAPGQLAVGVEYSYAELDLDKVRPNGDTLPIELDLHTAYLTGTVGVLEWLEVFVRVGGVSLDGDREAPGRKRQTLEWDYDYDNELIYGGGVRVTFGTIGNVTFGAVATYSYAEIDGDYMKETYGTGSPRSYLRSREWGSADSELHQLGIALGATWQLRENLSLYGGGLLHHVRLNQEIEYEDSERPKREDPERVYNVFKNDHSGSMLGGYLGLAWGINENLTLSVEGSLTEDSHGGSAMLGMAF